MKSQPKLPMERIEAVKVYENTINKMIARMSIPFKAKLIEENGVYAWQFD